MEKVRGDYAARQERGEALSIAFVAPGGVTLRGQAVLAFS
jgi:hypothetical protein